MKKIRIEVTEGYTVKPSSPAYPEIGRMLPMVRSVFIDDQEHTNVTGFAVQSDCQGSKGWAPVVSLTFYPDSVEVVMVDQDGVPVTSDSESVIGK